MSMMPFGIFGCLSPLVILGLAVVCIRILWVTLMPPSRMPREAACGRCGYSVVGLTTPSCPECGADWRVAGITTPALIMRYRGGLSGAIVAWTILMAGAALLGLSLVGIFYGRRMVSTMSTTPQTWTTPMTPASNAYKGVDVATTSIMGGRTTSGSVRLDLTLNSGAVWKFEVDPSTRTAVITDPGAPGAVATSPYAAGSVAAFFRTAGLDTTNAALAAEARELESVVDIQLISPYTQPSQMTLTVFTPGSPSFSGMTSMVSNAGSSAMTTGAIMLAGGLVCLVIYIAGIVFIVTRRRRLLGRFAAQTVYSPGM